MSNKPGHLAGEMKWLVARYPQPAGTLIKLGSVLVDPYEPETSLTRKTDPIAIDQDDILDQSHVLQAAIKEHFSKTRSGAANVDLPVWPLFNAGISAEGGTTESNQIMVEAKEIRAKIFLLDPKDSSASRYFSALLAKPEVIKQIRKHLFPPLYIIIGVATARRVGIAETRSTGHNLGLGVSGSLPVAGLEESVAASDEGARCSSVEYSIEGDLDFAYRIREFQYSRVRQKVKEEYKDVTTATLMGIDSESEEEGEEEDSEENDIPVFRYLDENDVEIEEQDNNELEMISV